MFASKTVLGHLTRGAVGAAAIACALAGAARHPWLPLAALPIALIAFRGCPTCWAVGLVQTVMARLNGTSTEGPCVDGSCVPDGVFRRGTSRHLRAGHDEARPAPWARPPRCWARD